MNRIQGLQLLRKALNNPEAQFRKDQWESISLLVNERKKLLVVERTGWGKSSVYFISARILRDQGKGVTIIISPLLALMRNQIEAARRLGLNAKTINSTNFEEWKAIKNAVFNDEVDALLISPERLANDKFMKQILRPIADKIGLFVVDEAHCISDWGHDFRPDYRRITNILKFMPDGMPLLGTTATANNRVIDDISNQLGRVNIVRGNLTRKSLRLQNIRLKDQASRLAWLKENIQKIPGTGIVYTLTIRDANYVASWLNTCGISANAYHSSITDEDFESNKAYKEHLEDRLYHNKIKVLVATTALGMGYDKPDLGFVIHFQAPNSLISYYQQVGRAGRAVDTAYGILLSGKEDAEIHRYFRKNTFPSEANVNFILKLLDEYDGLSINELMTHINLRKGQIEQVLKYLSVDSPSPIIKEGSKYKRTAVFYEMDVGKIERLTSKREEEWQEVNDYIDSTKCLMQFFKKALDDNDGTSCGKCANCQNKLLFSDAVSHENEVLASRYLKQSEFTIKPRKLIPSSALEIYDFGYRIPPDRQAEIGKVLSRWGDAGWGEIVAKDKYRLRFRDELVEAMAQMIRDRWDFLTPPTWVTCIPSSRHPELVPDFAKRVAIKIQLPFVSCITKVKDTAPQKKQENSFYQCRNLDGVFSVTEEVMPGPVLLIDDAVDSKWTFTIAAALLKEHGSGPVYPVALTSTAEK